jgi:type IV pilus assembly protein PilO
MELSLNKLPWYAQIGIFAAISAAGAVAFYQFYAVPAQSELAVRQQRLQSLRADINRGLATARKLPEFRREVDELEARLVDLRAVLPEQKDVADLLRRIQSLATQSNLNIRSFKPEPMSTKQLHAEWPIALEVDGTYHNLGYFFDRIGRFSRLINISNVEIQAKERQEVGSTISARFVATAFVLLDSARPGAKPAGGGGS